MRQNQVPIFSGGTHLHPGLKEPPQKRFQDMSLQQKQTHKKPENKQTYKIYFKMRYQKSSEQQKQSQQNQTRKL